jgi:hypothetical protein
LVKKGGVAGRNSSESAAGSAREEVGEACWLTRARFAAGVGAEERPVG